MARNPRRTERPIGDLASGRYIGPVTAKPTHADIACQLCELQLIRQKWVQGIGKQFGLSPQQLTLLYNLSKQQQPAMGEMAELMECDISNISLIVDKLEGRGLLRRVRCEDRRVKTLELTPDGTELLAGLLERLHEPAPWLCTLTGPEIEQFSALLSRCLESARDTVNR